MNTTTISVTSLRGGETLVGDCGGRSQIIGEVGESAAMPGMYRAETEHGTLYLDPDFDIDITADQPAPTSVSVLVYTSHGDTTVMPFSSEQNALDHLHTIISDNWNIARETYSDLGDMPTDRDEAIDRYFWIVEHETSSIHPLDLNSI